MMSETEAIRPLAIDPQTQTGGVQFRRFMRSPELLAGRVTGLLDPGESGRWSIETWEVTAQDEATEELRSILSSSSRGRMCSTGRYTALKRNGETIMSDTLDELLDLSEFARQVSRPECRRVVINGLGLGCALRIALAQPHVEHVDVVEQAEDVLALIGPGFDGEPRVALHHGDAYTFKWPSGTRWDIAWHDIWDSISTDNDFAGLHRRYGRRVRWQGSWCREEAERSDRRWRRENRWWLEAIR